VEEDVVSINVGIDKVQGREEGRKRLLSLSGGIEDLRDKKAQNIKISKHTR
jgi:hypothetical protein